MPDHAPTDFRRHAYDLLSTLSDQPGAVDRLADSLAEDCVFHFSDPIGTLSGPEAIRDGFYQPLATALTGLRRRDAIFIGGRNRREAGGDWVASVTHYVGTFAAPFAEIAPSRRLVFLRSGEFYRIAEGRIAEGRIILDLVDLLRQAGRMPLPRMLGTEMLFPSPATHDGVLPPSAGGEASLDLVEAMLGNLHAFDPSSFESRDLTGPGGVWHPEMLWYGPGGIGSTYRWDGFVQDHRRAFLTAFPDRKGGNHYARIGDGDYAAVSGWPSMTMTHQGEYLGQKADGRALTLRVMDFYRTTERPELGRRIVENWVLLDYIDLFRQMGRDLIAEAGEGSGRP